MYFRLSIFLLFNINLYNIGTNNTNFHTIIIGYKVTYMPKYMSIFKNKISK